MMNDILAHEELNTGRQREFDYLKGIFMLFIYLIHAFQVTLSPEDPFLQGIYMFATMSGAAMFIFVMGIGTVYSKNVAPVTFVKSGIRMVIYQYLNNLVYVAALLVPYPFVSERLSETGTKTLKMLIWIYIQYTNIFFITGIIYLVLALLKKMNIKTVWYAVIGVAVAILAPFVYGIPVDIPVLGYIVKLLIGDAYFVSFTPLYFLAYALLGVAFGKILRHVKNKVRFYGILTCPSIAIVAVWWILIFRRYGLDISEMRSALGYSYTHPDLWHVVASLAHIVIFAAIFFFIENLGGKKDGQSHPKNPFAKQVLYYSRHISKYYALHTIVYFIALGINGYMGFKSYQCWLLALLSILVTECMVRGYNYLMAKKQMMKEYDN